MTGVLQAFTGDPKVQALAILVVVDVVLGIAAAIKLKQFSFGRVSDFLKDDVLGKMIPYYALWAATYVGGDLVIPGLDVGAVSAAAFGAAALAMTASIVGSLKDLNLTGS